MDIEENEFGDEDANSWDCRPGTTLLFSLTIVEQLLGKEKSDEVAEPMMMVDTRKQGMVLY